MNLSYFRHKVLYRLQKAYWNLHSLTWDEYLDSTGYAPEIEEIVRLAEKYRKDASPALLDIGCATGCYSIAFARKNFKVTGIDFAPRMISRASEKTRVLNLKVDYFTADINGGLSFSPGSFDFVLSAHIFQGAEDKVRFIAEIHRVLKKGGHLLVVTKKPRDKRNGRKKKSKTFTGYILRTVKPFIYSGYDKRYFHIDDFMEMIETTGFTPAEMFETANNYVAVFTKR
jgi:ubiquinone/menaquinone biosynthesis C-methylase UbiE